MRTNKTNQTHANKLWIARNPDYTTFIDNEWEDMKGELCLFYDTPVLKYDEEKTRDIFTHARMICEIPSYMYPNITTENSPAVFCLETPDNSPSY